MITCPADIAVDAGLNCSTSVTITDPTATDNVSTTFTYQGVRSDGAALTDPFFAGVTTITWTATDDAGNTSETCTQQIIINGNGSCWEIVGADNIAGGSAFFTSIAVDQSGVPYIVYSDQQNGGVATVKSYNGVNWEDVGSPAISDGETRTSRITFDSNDTPYVVFRDLFNGGGVTVKRFNGISWENLGANSFSAGLALFTDIAIDPSGVPYVAYRDVENGDRVTVQKYESNSWQVIGEEGFSTGASDYVKHKFAGNGTLMSPIRTFLKKSKSYSSEIQWK